MLNGVYDKKVSCRKNIFFLPSGKSGKQYIEETSRFINSWIHNSPLQDVAFKAITVMMNLPPETGQKLKVKRSFRSLEQKIKLMERRRTDRVAQRG